MFRKRRINCICLMLMISVLLMGMCPTGIGADSFFASSCRNSFTSGSILRSSPLAATRTIEYTREVIPECEIAISPLSSLRRISMRHGNREWTSTICLLNISAIFAITSASLFKCFGDAIFSNTVIVRYIHHQDGAKV